MGTRKRGRDQMEVEEPVAKVAEMEEPSTLQKIRSMWEFASLMQYLFFFGKAVKLDDLDVEVRDNGHAPRHRILVASIELMISDDRTLKKNA
jgi:hypothetical protein